MSTPVLCLCLNESKCGIHLGALPCTKCVADAQVRVGRVRGTERVPMLKRFLPVFICLLISLSARIHLIKPLSVLTSVTGRSACSSSGCVRLLLYGACIILAFVTKAPLIGCNCVIHLCLLASTIGIKNLQ